jgi:hypothetical protein
MTLADCRQTYYEASTKASDLTRQLALAAIAVIWLFAAAATDGPKVAPALAWPLLLVIAALTLDVLQYVYKSIAWGAFAEHAWRTGVNDTDELAAPRWINRPALGFFWGKIILVVLAYAAILVELSRRVL